MKKNLFIAAAAMLMLASCGHGAKKKKPLHKEAVKEMCTKAEKECCEKKADFEKKIEHDKKH